MNWISGLYNIYADYEVFLFDLWGVTHNGQEAFPAALYVFLQLKKNEKTIFFLSNSPRPENLLKDHLLEMGINSSYYDGVYSSGSECYNLLREQESLQFYQNLGKHLFHIGEKTDERFFQDLPYTQVNSIYEADFILVTNVISESFASDEYSTILSLSEERKLPLICVNSDRVAYHRDTSYPCPGILGERYEKMGGKVYWHGKPSRETFASVHDRVNLLLNKKINKESILMIGDSLQTDILGANQYGIDSLLVLSGIHQHILYPDLNKVRDALDQLSETYQAMSTFVSSCVKWSS
jgi:HAD superfamily hydrolase (TIGR01459 family)